MIFIYIIMGIYALAMLFILLYSFAQANLLYHFFQFRKNIPKANPPAWEELPFVTIQLPIFNEKYVVERLIDAAAKFNYPKDKLEIQVLDDSTDETAEIIKSYLVRCYLHTDSSLGYF